MTDRGCGGWGSAVGGAVLALACVEPAAAQTVGDPLFDRGNNESVRERPRPDYAPIGVPLGAFRLYPEVSVGLGHTDNVFAAEAGEQADSFADLRGRARVDSQWSRHALRLTADAGLREYADRDEESTTGWGAGAEGRFDILRGTYAFGGVAVSNSREPRGVNDALAFAEPVQVEAERAFLGASREAGRVRLRLEGEIAQADFTDVALIGGGFADQDFRDEETRTLRGRLDVALSPDTAAFLTALTTQRDFDETTGFASRDFDQSQTLIGASFDLTRLIRGEVGLGYTWAEFADPARPDEDGFAAFGLVEWFPTQLTTIRLDVRRGLEASGILGAAAFTETAAGLRVDHEVRRNLLVNAELGYAQAEFAGLAREDEQVRLALGGDWLVNRMATLSAQLNHTTQDSAGAARGRAFDETEVTVAATLHR